MTGFIGGLGNQKHAQKVTKPLHHVTGRGVTQGLCEGYERDTRGIREVTLLVTRGYVVGYIWLRDRLRVVICEGVAICGTSSPLFASFAILWNCSIVWILFEMMNWTVPYDCGRTLALLLILPSR